MLKASVLTDIITALISISAIAAAARTPDLIGIPYLSFCRTRFKNLSALFQSFPKTHGKFPVIFFSSNSDTYRYRNSSNSPIYTSYLFFSSGVSTRLRHIISIANILFYLSIILIDSIPTLPPLTTSIILNSSFISFTTASFFVAV